MRVRVPHPSASFTKALHMNELLAFDTETLLIGRGAVAPKPICLSLAAPGGVYLAGNGDECFWEDVEELFEPGPILIGANTSYDLGVIVTHRPQLETKIWEKLMLGEITDVQIREQLLNLSTHGQLDSVTLPDGSSQQLSYSLAALAAKYLGKDRFDEKKDGSSPRLNYHMMDGRPSSHYPADYRDYAIEDATDTLAIYLEQQKRVETEDGRASLSTEFFHTTSDFALFLITIQGMRIDAERFEEIRQRTEADLSEEKLAPLYESGILRRGQPTRPHSRQLRKAEEIMEERHRPDSIAINGWEPYRAELEAEGIKFTKPVAPSKNLQKLKKHIREVAKANGVPLKLTASAPANADPEKVDVKFLSTDSEVISDLSIYDPLVEVYQHWQGLQKIVTTELPGMMWDDEISDRVHFPFKVLVRTTRTSSTANRLYPSRNGQQIDPRVRPCYVPDEGHVLVSVDYSTLELATVGQTMIDLFGSSVHAEKINSGMDLHGFLGARLAYELHDEFRATCDEYEATRGDDLYELFIQCKGHSDPEIAKFFKWWRKFAKPVGLGYPGGLGPVKFIGLAKKDYGVNVIEIARDMPEEKFVRTERLLDICKEELGMTPDKFRWTPAAKGFALAIKLREIWLDTFAMRPYYQWIQNSAKDTFSGKYAYTSRMGMHRAGCSYTAACNGKAMQTPAAEGAKAATILVTRAFRDPAVGSILLKKGHSVNFVHDEILAQIIEDDQMHERADEISRIMIEAMRLQLPDIDVKTEAALMRRWHKEAEPVFDEAGRLQIWEPSA